MGLLFLFIFIFFENPLLSAGRTRFSKTKKAKKKKNNLDQFLTLEKAKRRSNWSLLETPTSIEFLYKFSFKMLKFEAQFWSTFQTRENQFELLSGRFVDPELPFKIWPRIQAKKKKKDTTKKRQQHETQTLLSAESERSVFGKKRKKISIFFFCPWAVGISVAKGL